MFFVSFSLFYFSLYQAVLTSIVLKRNVTMLDIVSTRMLGQFGFLAKVTESSTVYSDGSISFPNIQKAICIKLFLIQVFTTFEDLGISVDVVATSEVSISLTLDPSKLWSRELIQQASI